MARITKVLITFARSIEGFKQQTDYPLAVRIYREDDQPGYEPQDYLVRNIREGRIFGNGVCAADYKNGPVNPELDPRLIDTGVAKL